MNNAENGVFLPVEFHQVLHTAEYFEAVTEALTSAKPGTIAMVLNNIRNQLLSGIFPYQVGAIQFFSASDTALKASL